MAWTNIGNIRGPAGTGVPVGGTTGQVLTKTSAVDYATNWQTPSGGGGGGGIGLSDFNVKDYGAVGNGVTDDRPAIQAALDAAGATGQVIFFPPGVYALKSMTMAGDRILRTYANQTLRGAGRAAAKLLVGASLGDYRTVIGLLNGSTYCGTWAMQDLCIDQNAANGNALNVPSMLTYPRTAVLVGSAAAGGSVTIIDCEFANSDSVNALYLYANELTISDNLFRGQGGPVGAAWHDSSTVYTTSYLANATQTITSNTFQGVLGAGGSYTAIETHGGSQVITGNTISGHAVGMNLTGISQDAFPTDGVTCIGNAITRCAVGVHIWSSYSAGLPSGTVMRNVVVAENVISCDRQAWVGVTGHLWYAAGVATELTNTAPIEGLTISNNQITNLPITTMVASDYNSPGIHIGVNSTTAEIRDLHIQGNTIVHPLSTGIRLAADIRRASISDNLVVNPAQSTDATVNNAYKAGISVFRALHDVSIDRNQMIDTRATHYANYCVYSNPTAATNCYARHNMVRYTDAVGPQSSFYPADNTAGAQFFMEDASSNGAIPFFNVKAGSKVTNTTTGAMVVQSTSPVGTTWTAFGAAGYVHVQGSPTSTWDITHNLGFYPNLTVVDSSETQVEGTVTYTGINTMTVTFTAAFSGRGYLS